jgi:FkbM family methyltransferase
VLASRLGYYLASIPRLVGFRNWPTAFALLLGLPVRRPVDLVLRGTGLVLRVRTALDAWLVKEVCIERQYEAASRPIQDGWTVIDVGSGIGEFALDVATRFPRAVVWAYEPGEETFRLLEHNIATNGLSNVRARRSAVGAESGLVLLQSAAEGALATTLADGGGGTPVDAVTLDSILRTNDIARCDYLKIDCEGCEYPALLSASDDALGRIGVICLEYHDRLAGRSHLELRERLERNGFQVSTQASPVHRGQGLLSAVKREPRPACEPGPAR